MNDTMLFSLQMGERLSTAPSSDLESKIGTPLPCAEHNVDDIFPQQSTTSTICIQWLEFGQAE